MLICNFSGNAGNSLTQYIITRTVADRLGYEFGFNPKFNYDYHGGINQLSFLDLDYGKIHNADFHSSPDGVTNVWEEKYQKFYYPNGDEIMFHDYDESIFSIPDNTRLVIPCAQDARYYNKEKVLEWVKIKDQCEYDMSKYLIQNDIFLDNDLVVINVRGGEYKGVPQVLLQKKYWEDAMKIMIDKNPNSRFMVVTDDVEYSKQLFNHSISVVHLNIFGDYFILNNAKNLILSNSSFAIWPVWLNKNNPFVIAPTYWARHNVSTGYWCSSNVWTYGWNFIDREGKIYER